MSSYNSLHMLCLRRAIQASRGVNIIWALETGKRPLKDDLDTVEELFDQMEDEDNNSHSYSNLKPPTSPSNLNSFIRNINTQSTSILGIQNTWKQYFDTLSSYYLKRAYEYKQKCFVK